MPETVRSAFADRARPLLSYGIPFPAAAARHVAETFAASRVYVICSGSLARNTDALDRLVAALGPDKVVGRRIGMKSHTLWSEVLEIVADVRRVEADLLLTLGAGSLTDGAKVVALALANNVQTTSDLASLAQDPEDRPDTRPPTLPIISIPTSLSAGEYSNGAGATDDTTRHKHSFRGPTRGPQLVILDPALATTTPDAIWLSTGIRAVDHCIETLCATTGTTDASDKHALHALRQLVPGLLRCHRARARRTHPNTDTNTNTNTNTNATTDNTDPDLDLDLDAHLLCQLGSVDAMAALTAGAGGVPVELGASHGIGHQLGPLGVGHGETSCILLPAVCAYNARHGANVSQQARAAEFLMRDEEVVAAVARWRERSKDCEPSENDKNDDARTAELSEVLDAVIRELGMPRSLGEVGVGREALDALAVNSLQDRWCVTNPVPLREKEQVLEILEMVV